MFNEYPYRNLTDVNLDFFLKRIKELEINLQDFIKLNTIKYADPIDWNISKQYEANTVVINEFTGVAYLSTKPVPSGVDVTNIDYWTPIFTLDFVNMNKNITIRNDGNNNNATFESSTGDWIIVGGQLYKVIQDIALHTAYVVGYNIDVYSVELFVRDYLNQVLNLIGDLDDLTTSDKTSIVNAINEVIENIGNLQELETEDKTSVVNGINSVVNDINSVVATIGELQDLHTTNKTSIVNSINELADKKTIVNVNDFSPSLNGADDSTAVQNAFNYAGQHNIPIVVFDDIDNISFKEINITHSVKVYFNDTIVTGIQRQGESVKNLFNITGSGIDVEFIGGTFKGLYNTGLTDFDNNVEPFILVNNIHSFTLKNCYFTHINNTESTPSAVFSERISGILNVYDVHNTKIDGCIFDTIHAEEMMFIMDKTLDRDQVNLEVCNCKFNSGIYTSSLDFCGNVYYSHNNLYDYQYPGSAVNCFALYLYAHNDTFKGSFESIYDMTEGLFQGLNADISNIYINSCHRAFSLSSRYVSIKNVVLRNLYDVYNDRTAKFIALQHGKFDDTNFHKDVINGDVPFVSAIIENVDLTETYQSTITDYRMFDAEKTSAWANIPKITFNNCSFIHNNHGADGNFTGCDVFLNRCKIFESLRFITTARLFSFVALPDFGFPHALTINNCFIVKDDSELPQDVIYCSNDTYKFVVNSYASGSVNANSVFTGTVVNANINIS